MRTALVLATLALVGCGGGDDADAGPDAATDAGEDAGPADLGTDASDAGLDAGPVDLGTDSGPVDLGTDAGSPPMCGALRRVHVLPAGMLAAPTVALAPPGDDRLFVVDRLAGRVRVLDAAGALATTPFVDVSASIDTTGYEAGLLALAFDPDWPTTTRVYASYTTATTLRVVRFDATAATADSVEAASETTILEIPTFVHHDVSGWLAFGPDGYLYVGTGDNSQEMLAQNRASLLAKVLRIDVHAAGVPYAVPPTNPFVGVAGVAPEIFAYGLRMPYRFAFDGGDLYVGEVGDMAWEELDVIPSGDPGGENFGWPVMEGPGCRLPPIGCDTTGLVRPDYAYSHDGGHAAVVGGPVYRGTALPSCWQGRWFFADYEAGWLGSLRWDAAAGATGVERYDALALGYVVSLGVDGHGEVLVLGADGSIDRLVPAP